MPHSLAVLELWGTFDTLFRRCIPLDPVSSMIPGPRLKSLTDSLSKEKQAKVTPISFSTTLQVIQWKSEAMMARRVIQTSVLGDA